MKAIPAHALVRLLLDLDCSGLDVRETRLLGVDEPDRSKGGTGFHQQFSRDWPREPEARAGFVRRLTALGTLLGHLPVTGLHGSPLTVGCGPPIRASWDGDQPTLTQDGAIFTLEENGAVMTEGGSRSLFHRGKARYE
jgi:hypothetical protein